MQELYYFVYAENILGVQTNDKNFKWIYGSYAPSANEGDFNKCLIRVILNVVSDKNIQRCSSVDCQFQCFSWDDRNKTLIFKRNVMGKKLAYSISITGNIIHAQFGKTYYKYVKHRFMNLHSAYYILSDLANMLLIKNGYASLYCSAVCNRSLSNVTAFFAPPNTGKTITAIHLCKEFDYRLISEDVAITDGKSIWGCPWTNSVRPSKKRLSFFGDSAGSLFRRKHSCSQNDKFISNVKLTDFVLLDKSAHNAMDVTSKDIVKRVTILNGYIFNYCCSPIIKIFAYFDSNYYTNWLSETEYIVKNLIESCCFCKISNRDALKFFKIFNDIQNK